MTDCPVLDAIESQARAESGSVRAAEHANDQTSGWPWLALTHLHDHAKKHEMFTIEEVRAALPAEFPAPPDPRAWGSVARVAAHRGLISRIEVVKAKSVTVHAMWVTLWRSEVFGQ